MSVLDLTGGLAQLLPIVKKKKLIIFVGSGISVPSGLPQWDELLDRFIAFCDSIRITLSVPELTQELIDASRADKARYPIRVASVLKGKLNQIEKNRIANFDKMFRKWFLSIFTSKPFNPNHKLIVTTDYPFILTSNYDNLLEEAAEASGHIELSANSFTFKDADKVGGAIYENVPSIVHIHGDISDIALDDFVFTSEDYMRIKKKYPGFTMGIQSLFMHYSILFVGYGGSDPHLEDFIEELCYYFEWSPSPTLPRFFLLLKEDKVNDVLWNYKHKLRTDLIVLDDYSKTTTLLEEIQKAVPRP
jgi:hypothetical protein